VKVLICGSRGWNNIGLIRERIAQLPGNAEVIEGGAHGADILARKYALLCGLDVVEYPANWQRHGNGAGKARNIRMLEREKPDLVIAFHVGDSPGTAHTIREARKRGVPVEVLP
jgi:hypothetical protein